MGHLMLVVFSVFGLLPAQEEYFIEGSSAVGAKLDIAVIPLENKTPTKPSDLAWKVVESDLKYSGRFNVTVTDRPDTARFRAAGVSVFVSGQCEFRNGKYLVNYSLSDALSQSPISAKQYDVPENSLRRAAHLFSDEVVYRLFGEKGIACTRLTAVQKNGRGKEVVLLDYDGQNLSRLTNNGVLNLTPAWSPDNKTVLYTSYREKTPAIYATAIHTGQTRRLTANARLNFAPSWNGIEDKIAFASSVTGDCKIFLMDRDGGGMRQLTFRDCIESSPCFSPNGYEIAFSSDRTGNPQVYVMDSEGGNQRRLTFEGKYNDAPSWSPRGDRIAYQSLESNRFNIVTIDPDGSNAKHLTRDAGSNEQPSYSPDGRLIVFTSTRAGGSDLYLMNEDGSGQTRITFTGDLFSPEWSGY